MKIFVVDDEPVQESMVAEALAEAGHQTRGFNDPSEALQAIEDSGADLLITDHKMPGMTGLELIQKALATDPGLHAVIVTAFGTVETAVKAMQAGAFDFLTKPLDLDHLLLVVEKSRKQRELMRENQALRQSLSEKNTVPGIIGESQAMAEVFSVIHRVAPTKASVLIRGESGTGKELLARAIHGHSPRQDQPFVAVNSAALPETLLESELFGHEKGAFSGAASRRQGKFEAAHGGTLFLDEIGEIPLPVQVKLLRFLQDHSLERLGSNDPIHVDVRLVAATNRDLEEAISDGSFREDLYYRLNVVPLLVPPLRNRKSDIPLLVRHFLKKFSSQHGKAVMGYSQDVYDRLMRHPFPGNVRELENIVENAVVMCRGESLSMEDLPAHLQTAPDAPSPVTDAQSLPLAVEQLETRLITRALEAADGIQTRAAQSLGISERTLRYKMKKLGLGKG